MKKFLLISILAIHFIEISAQSNIYDYNNIIKFADYLFATSQYGYAAEEYQRALFINEEDAYARLMLIKSYRLNNNPIQGMKIVEKHFPTITQMPPDIAEEYLKCTILSDSINKSFKILENTKIPQNKRNTYKATIYFIDNQIHKAQEIINKTKDTDKTIAFYITNYTKEKHKNPAFASIMSAILPGSGKIYSGYTRDGIISALFVVSNAYAAWHSYHNKGKNNYLTIIYTGLTIGFYIGNIYGSFKAAKRHNNSIKNAYKKNIINHINYAN